MRRLDSITAALGVPGVQAQTTFGYDLQGRRTLELFADGTALNHSYDLPGRLLVTSHSVPNDTHTYFNTTNTYDNAGRLITVSNYYGQLQALVYDALDRVCTNIDANGVAVVTAYDSLGRPTQRAYPDNGSEYFGYSFNVAGPTSYTNQVSNVFLYAYDSAGRKTNEASVGVSTNQFFYDGSGNLTNLVNGNGHSTLWKYDEYGRLTNKVDALGAKASSMDTMPTAA